MRRFVCLALPGGVLLAGCTRSGAGASWSSPAAGKDVTVSFMSGGLTRTFILHLPPQLAQDKPLPLVLALHGRLGDGKGMIKITRMSTVADKFGFLVAFPDGYQRSWSDGRGGGPAEKAGVDDVAFLHQLLELVRERYAIDATRIYATGFSNGGFMTQRLGCELANTFAAIASVAATFAENQAASCAPTVPMPYLLIHGTGDPFTPYGGGKLSGDRGVALSAFDSLTHWASYDHCPVALTHYDLPDTANDGTTTHITGYAGCAGGAQVDLYTVEHGGHTWPGGEQYLPVSVVGKTSRDMDASQVIWQFFAHFTRSTNA